MIELKDVTYRYPHQDKYAVKNINIKVSPGELVVCTGVSGCGKTTLIRLINGLCPHYYGGKIIGDIRVCGKNTLDNTIGELSKLTGSLFQDPEQQFFALNVDDELAFALEWRGMEPKDIVSGIDKVAKDFNITDILSSTVNSLSEGQKQKVGLASIILQKAKVIILDEPTANLDVEATLDFGKKLLELKSQGYTILVVDHRLYWTKDIADRYIIMSEGEIIKEGGYNILEDDVLRDEFGIRNILVEDRRDALEDWSLSDKYCIDINNLSFAWKGKSRIFDKVSFNIPMGVTAIIGHNGAGKTTLARLLTGLTKMEEGDINIKGEKLDKKVLRSKASLVLQNADYQLYMRSAFEEIWTSIDLSHKNMDKLEKEKRVNELLDKFGLMHLKDRHPQSLSGGEKQRLVIACAVAKEPEIIILDEPTSGLDGRNMNRIANILIELGKQGVAVIVITHDLELINKICRYSIKLPFKKMSD